jgi:hypothetical protein
MKTRTLMRRIAKAETVSTALDRAILAGQAGEPQSEAPWRDDDLPPNPDDRAALHRYLDRAARAFASRYPVGFEPLEKSLASWANAEYPGRREHEDHLRQELAEAGVAQVDQAEDEDEPRPEPQQKTRRLQ